jgi:hypothetical protein
MGIHPQAAHGQGSLQQQVSTSMVCAMAQSGIRSQDPYLRCMWTDCSHGDRDGTGSGKAAAATADALTSISKMADCAGAERRVRVPLGPSFWNSSSDKPVGLRSEFQTSTYGKHITREALTSTQQAHPCQTCKSSARPAKGPLGSLAGHSGRSSHCLQASTPGIPSRLSPERRCLPGKMCSRL